MAGPSPMLEYAYFEGNIVPFADAKISVGTHALQYGTGAFAGIRGYLDQDGETINIFRLPEHAARLLNSAKLLRAAAPLHPGDVWRRRSSIWSRRTRRPATSTSAPSSTSRPSSSRRVSTGSTTSWRSTCSSSATTSTPSPG